MEGVAVGVRVGCGDGLWPLDRVGLEDGFAVGDGFGDDVAVGDDFAVPGDFTLADVWSTVFDPVVVARLGVPCHRAVPAVREVRARGATCACAATVPGLGRRGAAAAPAGSGRPRAY